MGEGEDGGIGAGLGSGIGAGIGDGIGSGIGSGIGEGIASGIGEGIGSALGDAIGNDFGFTGDFGSALGSSFGSGIAGTALGNSVSDSISSAEGSTESWLSKMLNNPFAKALAVIASKSNPAIGLAFGLGKAATSSNPSQNMLGFMGNTVGNAALGFGIPGFGLGNGMAGLAGMATAGAGAPGDTSEGNSGMGAGLAGLFGNYMGMRENDRMLGGLQSLYSKNSPYAQQLRQQLERRDAAGGRRSQYGPREVELQAKLAQMASGQIPAMTQLSQNKQMMRNQMLQSGLYAAQKAGLFKNLGSLFQGGGGMPSYTPQEGSQYFMGPPSSEDMYPDFSLPSFMGT